MQNNGSILYDYQQGRSAGRRRVRRVRTYTLEQAITPKTCGLLPGSSSPVVRDFSETKTESQLCELLINDESIFYYHNEDEITLNVSNNFDVYFNLNEKI